jgi:3,4-dihydroxy 2-butanone 4-phosphate synthase
VLCELMNADGSMARGAEVVAFAGRHGLLCTTVAAVRAHRLASAAAAA